MVFVDRPLPQSLELPRLRELSPRDRRLANLRRGGPSGNGRIKGQQNKITRDLKEGLIEGAVQAGFDGQGEDGLIGYCKWMAIFHPRAYAHLLGKVLPHTISANVSSASINEVRILSIPSGQHLTRAAIDALEHDHTLQAVPAEANLLEPTPIEPMPPAGQEKSEASEQALMDLSESIERLSRQVEGVLNGK